MRLSPVIAVTMALIAQVWGVDEAQPYGRCAVTLTDPETDSVQALEPGSSLPQGAKIRVHVETNTAGEALVVALARKSLRLAHGWRPAMLKLHEWEEQLVPQKGSEWVWPANPVPFDVYVVLFADDDFAKSPLRNLAVQLSDVTSSPETLDRASRSLREEITKLQASQKLASEPERSPTAIGGTLRAGAAFPWREVARKANFAKGQPCVIVFRHAQGQ
jgi:hypothetical protein